MPQVETIGGRELMCKSKTVNVGKSCEPEGGRSGAREVPAGRVDVTGKGAGHPHPLMVQLVSTHV